MSSEGVALEANVVVERTGLFPWWLVLIEGIAAIIIGILLFLAPQATLELVIQIFGLFWLVDGLLRIVSAFVDPTDRGLKLTAGGIGILAGIVVMRHPALLAVMFTWMLVLLLGGAGVVIGAISLFMAFRGGGWGAAILGVLSLLFGLLILLNPYLTGFAWIFLYAGVSLVGGLIAVVQAFRSRKAAATAASSAHPIGTGQPAHPEPT